jgi:hypothetical protein
MASSLYVTGPSEWPRVDITLLAEPGLSAISRSRPVCYVRVLNAYTYGTPAHRCHKALVR